jgi:arylsulfatase A-like enzyme
MYAHNHGIRTGQPPAGGYEKFRASRLERFTINVRLQQRGYRTAMVGKFLNGYEVKQEPPRGWSQWFATVPRYTNFAVRENNKVVHYKNGYLTDVQRTFALEFIDATPRRQPFFLYFAPKAPHEPSIPAKRHRNAYGGVRITRNPAFNEADVSDKPAYIRALPRLNRARLDREERRRLATLRAADEAIAAIYNKVKQRGQLRRTYFFIVSDNGWTGGEHRLNTKGVPYDGSIRVPMLAVGPRFAHGAVDNRLVANIDLPVTLAALAGVKLPRADGKSLFTVNRTGVLVEGFRLVAGSPGFVGIRTRTHLYVVYASGERELYDHRVDPYELDNLLADWEGHTPRADPEVVAFLQEELTRLLTE